RTLRSFSLRSERSARAHSPAVRRGSIAPRFGMTLAGSSVLIVERAATELDLSDLSVVRRILHRDRRDDALVRALSVDPGAAVPEGEAGRVHRVVAPRQAANRVAHWQLLDVEELDVLYVSVEVIDVKVHARRIEVAARNKDPRPGCSVVAAEDLSGLVSAGG